MTSQLPSEVDPSALPAVVRHYAEKALSGVGPGGSTVRVTQEGEMILRPGASPRRFTAVEEFAADQVAFAWRARFPLAGPLALRVTDSYHAGQGLLDVRCLGLALQRQRGPGLALGQAFRYLAELPWVPQAIIANPELEWLHADDRHAQVATVIGGQRAEVKVRFNDQGEIVRTQARRPRAEAGNALTLWIGEFYDYEERGGVWIPTRGEVRWELPEGPFTYWRGTIASLEVRP